MLDAPARRLIRQPLGRLAAGIDKPWLSADRLTMIGLALGLASAASSAARQWWLSLALWLLSRLADGLDGPLARRRIESARIKNQPARAHGAGGFLDITSDFIVYGATVIGVAIGVNIAYQAPWWPFLLVLFAYYINGTAFLAFSSIAERAGQAIDDGRSLSFLGGVAEATETIIVHCLWLVFPVIAWRIALVWGAVVGVSAAARIVVGYRVLS